MEFTIEQEEHIRNVRNAIMPAIKYIDLLKENESYFKQEIIATFEPFEEIPLVTKKDIEEIKNEILNEGDSNV